MSKAPPSFQFYPQDWLVGTAGLSHSSKATYLLLLCYEWTQEKLRFDPPKLAVMLGVSESEFNAHWQELEEKFTINEDGNLINDKLESIREEVLTRSRARAEAGRKGGRSKARNLLLANGKQKPSKGSLKSKDRSLKSKKRKSGRAETQPNPLPPVLDCEEFQAAWSAWKKYKGRAYKPAGEKALLTRAAKRAEEHGVSAVVDAMELAMANSWQGWDHEQEFSRPKARKHPGLLDDVFGSPQDAQDASGATQADKGDP